MDVYLLFSLLTILTILCPLLAYAEICSYVKGVIWLSNILFILVNIARVAFLVLVVNIILFWQIA